MIEITTIGSSSSGNCYILNCTPDGGSVSKLIIEAGVTFNSVQKALKFDLNGISGCLVSHEHGDHAGFVKDFLRFRIPIYATDGTLDKLGLLESSDWNGCHRIILKSRIKIDSFYVTPFETEHDAAEPCGFVIDCPDGNRVVFATDTYYLKYLFRDVTVFMIECNYEKKMLLRNIKNGSVHPSVAERVFKSHLSVANCIEILKANVSSITKAIILIHLSEQNSSELDFINRIEKETGKMVHVARKNKTITIL